MSNRLILWCNSGSRRRKQQRHFFVDLHFNVSQIVSGYFCSNILDHIKINRQLSIEEEREVERKPQGETFSNEIIIKEERKKEKKTRAYARREGERERETEKEEESKSATNCTLWPTFSPGKKKITARSGWEEAGGA